MRNIMEEQELKEALKHICYRLDLKCNRLKILREELTGNLKRRLLLKRIKKEVESEIKNLRKKETLINKELDNI